MRSWSIRRNLLALTLLAVALFLATALLLVASNHRYQARLALVTPHAVAQQGGDLAESNRQLREALHDREIALAVQARASDRLAIGGFVVAAVLAAIFCGLFVLDGVSGRIARWHRGLRRVRGMPDVGELTQNLERAMEAARSRETELRRSSDFLEFAQAAGGFGVFDLDLRTREITGTALFFELIGMSNGALNLTQDQWLSTVHPADLESFVERIGDAMANGSSFETEYRSLQLDGGFRWLASRGRVLLEGEAAARMIGTVTEITARKRLEENLRRTSQSLSMAQTVADVATFDINLATGECFASDNYHELLRIPPSTPLTDLAGHLEHVHPDDLQAALGAPFNVPAGETQYRCEFRVVQEDGSVRWMGEKASIRRGKTGALTRVAGALVDVTDLKLAQAALNSTEERLARAIRGTQDGFWEFTVAGQVPWFSERFEELLGYAPGDLRISGEEYYRMVHPDDLQTLFDHVEAHLYRHEPLDIEYRVRHKAGHYEWLRVRATAERDADGHAIRIAGSALLVTDRKRAEQATLEARRAAEDANRAKSAFLANVSHEIRTPMNGVIGMAQILAETELDTAQKEYVDIIRGSAQNLLSLINDVLDLSKIEADHLELERVEFVMRDLVYQSVAAIALQGAAKGIEPVVHAAADVPFRVFGDPGRLRQIITNLMSNAIKFTHEGHVRIGVGCTPLAEGRVLLRIEVTDSGIGIPADRQDKLFKAFSQVDSSTTRHYGGTGLGLSIVKRLAELMGGEVGLESEPGKGSTFWATANLEVAEGALIVPPLGRGRRILLVDDLEASRDSIGAKLGMFGFDWVGVAGVDAALELLEHDAAFNAVLADEWMPGRGGRQLLEALRADPRHAHLPLVLMPMFGSEHGADQWPVPPDAVCQKPMRALQFAQLLDDLLSGRTPAAPPKIASQAEVHTVAGARILLVEDNPVNQRIAQRMLQKQGAVVTIAGHGAEALERLDAAPFDLVLMDCQMPVMDGFTATRRIREREAAAGRGEHLPIIALTANVMSQDREQCRAAGMDDHLGKPIDAAVLAECLVRHYRPADAPPALDREALRELIGEDAEFERELLDTFIASGDRSLADILEALRHRDYETIGRRAHALKGASANIHAPALTKTAASLERAIQARATTGLDKLVDQLGLQLQQFRAQAHRA
jgi:PAS domain S-box-containing protein